MTLTETAIRELAQRNAAVQVADIERRGNGSFTIDDGVEIEVGEFDPPCCCDSCDASPTLTVTFTPELTVTFLPEPPTP